MPIHDAQFPKNDRQTFDGGKNNKFDKYLIANNESPDLLNVVLDNRSAETRLGSQKFNSTSVGSFPGDGLYTHHKTIAPNRCALGLTALFTLQGQTLL